jgi:hypothetical protein
MISDNEKVAICIIAIVFFGVGILVLNGLSLAKEDKLDAAPHELVQMGYLKSMIKGSIYGGGETMSVFGTCTDANDVPLNSTTGTLSAWYPNGTQYIFNDPMLEISPGYFIWNGEMSNVKGTYLTEFLCNASIWGGSYYSRAWGEWQNPYWVEAIFNLSDDLANLSLDLNLTNEYILNMNQTMVTNFNTTNQYIMDTQIIANASVDRNDSLLAQLLYFLVNWSTTENPFCGNLTADQFSVGNPIYWKDWTIKVFARDGDGDGIGYPDAYCLINTTQNPTQSYMDDEGDHFTYTEFNKVKPGGQFDWTIHCGCAT